MSIIELKVTLEYVAPPVIRILKVPLTIRLDRLHLTLQAALGWSNYHLYEFMAAGVSWGLPDPDFDDGILPASQATLQDVIEDTSVQELRYIYDFGDNWSHQIEIGDISDPIQGDLYPKLISLSGKCPPEDVGGPPGYEGFLAAMADPKQAEHEQIKEWYGSVFDPQAPETDELKLNVLKLAKKWKPQKPKNK